MSLRRPLVIVGLGNHDLPLTRHSIGQLIVNNLPSHVGFRSSFVRQGTLPGNTQTLTLPSASAPLHLLIPLVPMNLSGRPVFRYLTDLSLSPSQLVLIHDDLSLAPGVVKLKFGGSPGGHNGVKDVGKSFKGEMGFWRVRVGIGRPDKNDANSARGGRTVTDWVLGRLSKEEVLKCAAGGETLETVWRLLKQVDSGEI